MKYSICISYKGHGQALLLTLRRIGCHTELCTTDWYWTSSSDIQYDIRTLLEMIMLVHFGSLLRFVEVESALLLRHLSTTCSKVAR